MKHYVHGSRSTASAMPPLDAEHKRLLGMVDDLYQAIQTGNEGVDFQDVLEQLANYTMTHFDHEERVMQQCGYPSLEAHVPCTRRCGGALEFKANPDAIVGRELLQFLKNWWVRHIQNQDKAYAPYLDAIARQPIKME